MKNLIEQCWTVKREINMGESELEGNQRYSVKSHKEIIELIDELKDIEREFGFKEIEPAFIEVHEEAVEFIEVEHEIIEEFEPILPVTTNKKGSRFKIKYRTRAEVRKFKEERKKYDPATFRMRFNNEGALVNIDVDKTTSKRKLRKIKLKEKEKIEDKEHKETDENITKRSRFRRGLSILRRSLPKKEETVDEEEDEEEEEDY